MIIPSFAPTLFSLSPSLSTLNFCKLAFWLSPKFNYRTLILWGTLSLLLHSTLSSYFKMGTWVEVKGLRRMEGMCKMGGSCFIYQRVLWASVHFRINTPRPSMRGECFWKCVIWVSNGNDSLLNFGSSYLQVTMLEFVGMDRKSFDYLCHSC